LITSFSTLPNADLILAVIAEQEAESQEPGTASNNPIDTIDLSIAALSFPSVLGFGSEFGALQTITSPNPYVINSGTKIMTAPTITTSGVTNQGKIYRGPGQDGDPTAYLFGSTSSFDTSSGFDAQLQQEFNLPIAAFKFTNLHI